MTDIEALLGKAGAFEAELRATYQEYLDAIESAELLKEPAERLYEMLRGLDGGVARPFWLTRTAASVIIEPAPARMGEPEVEAVLAAVAEADEALVAAANTMAVTVGARPGWKDSRAIPRYDDTVQLRGRKPVKEDGRQIWKEHVWAQHDAELIHRIEAGQSYREIGLALGTTAQAVSGRAQTLRARGEVGHSPNARSAGARKAQVVVGVGKPAVTPQPAPPAPPELVEHILIEEPLGKFRDSWATIDSQIVRLANQGHDFRSIAASIGRDPGDVRRRMDILLAKGQLRTTASRR